jgi:hypothetical protein
MKGESGMVKVLIIPIESNKLTLKDDAVYMSVRTVIRDEPDQYGQDGFISQSVDSKIYKEATDEEKEEFKKLPILGNIKDFSGSGKSDASGAQSANLSASEKEDDLPF